MNETAARSAIEQAFVHACTLDVAVMKPGNVSLQSPGHGMTAAQFLASAAAAAPAVCATGAPIGRRILDAVQASRAAAACNTNLGILLLCAPIAAALEAGVPTEAALRQELQRRLRALTVADAQAAFRAIALANPGGLGASDEHDVHREPTVNLRVAMELASERDLIARQYANGYADLFDTGLAAWRAALTSKGHALQHAMQRVYLAFLARFPDSHIVRKHGLPAARTVTREARYWRRRLIADASAAQPGLAQWDAELKSAGLNPGTSADLAVATAFLAQAIVLPFGHGHTTPG
jgi:triphosphoribosyl-dephospho-CoA synthase